MRDMWIMRIPYSRLQPLLTQPVHIVFNTQCRYYDLVLIESPVISRGIHSDTEASDSH